MKLKSDGYRGRHWVMTSAMFLGMLAMLSLSMRIRAEISSGYGDTAQTKAAAGVTGLIAHLHAELKITPEQEALFQKLAAVMRDNAETMGTLAKNRADSAKTMTAVDDLKSYAEISAAHAEGSKKMISAFQPLYDSMSDEQRKAADEEFREHYATHHRRNS